MGNVPSLVRVNSACLDHLAEVFTCRSRIPSRLGGKESRLSGRSIRYKSAWNGRPSFLPWALELESEAVLYSNCPAPLPREAPHDRFPAPEEHRGAPES